MPSDNPTAFCSVCGVELGTLSTYHDGGGDPLCMACWEDLFHMGADPIEDDEDED